MWHKPGRLGQNTRSNSLIIAIAECDRERDDRTTFFIAGETIAINAENYSGAN
ncbi:MAG: hypothetical protein M3N42_05810 [Cyanobacteriota bacterium]|nr:hypothetical protein [Cyanobacteriota bacterium]